MMPRALTGEHPAANQLVRWSHRRNRVDLGVPRWLGSARVHGRHLIRKAGRGSRGGVSLMGAVLLVLATAPAAFGADRAYWANGNDTISYANLDGSGGGGQLNLSGATPSGPRGVAVDPVAGRIYWANQGNDTISYANLDGSGGGGQLNPGTAPIVHPPGEAADPPRARNYWAHDGGNPLAYAHLDRPCAGQL